MTIEETANIKKGENLKASSFPFLATIKERYCLNKPGSDKQTYHVVLDLSTSGIQYSVGDCLGVYPENDLYFVNKILECASLSGEELVKNRQEDICSLKTFLLKEANIFRVPKMLQSCESPFLHEHLRIKKIDAQTLASVLSPLMPRFYSIASSMKVVGNEAHLTVALTPGTLEEEALPFGICSHYLCSRVVTDQPMVPLFLQKSRHFSLPEESNDKPIIMIGPGTGIAPFRGFMQERVVRKASSKNWLFFGERRQASDFYYQDFWEKLSNEEMLKLDCAFSRDQENKIYVQHKMEQNSSLLWRWLEDEAYLFVCGDASKMAKDVDKTLLSIIEQEGKMDTASAKSYIKNLKSTNRYQRDVY